MTLPTREQLDRIFAEADRLTPAANKWSPYRMATAAPIGVGGPLVLDHNYASDLLTRVRLRKPCPCSRCGERPILRRLAENVMAELGKLPGSDSQRRLNGDQS